MNEGTEIPSVDSTLKILSIQLFLLRADTAPTKRPANTPTTRA